MRQRIFDSALRQFSQNGYAGTSLRAISEHAGATKPMVYYYFGSKEELYVSIVEGIVDEMAQAVRGSSSLHGPAVEQVREYCRRYVTHFLAHEERIALVLREVFGPGGQPIAAFANALSARVRCPLDDMLRAGMLNGELRPGQPESCATAITGILNAFILAHVFGGLPIDACRPLEQVDYYLCGMSLPPARH